MRHVLDSIALAACAGVGAALVVPLMVRWLRPVAELGARLDWWPLSGLVLLPFLAVAVCRPAVLPSLWDSASLLFRGHVGLVWKLAGAFLFYLPAAWAFCPEDLAGLGLFILVVPLLTWCFGLGVALSLLIKWLGSSARPRRRADSAAEGPDRWDDLPLERVEDDKLRLAKFAGRVLNDLLGPATSGEVQKPSVAIIGGYGSGKTTVCNFVKDIYRRRPKESKLPNARFATFEAWQYRTPDAALHALAEKAVSAISEEVDDPALWSVPADFVRAAGASAGTLGKLLGGILPSDRSPRDVLKALGEVLVRLDMRLIVFVDDLDRIQETAPECQKAVVAALNDLQSVPNVQYVVAADMRVAGDGPGDGLVDLLKLTRFTRHMPPMDPERATEWLQKERDAAKADESCLYPWDLRPPR